MANLKRRRKRRGDTAEYKPGPTDSEKAASHRKAQAAYYARHDYVREKNPLKQRWDPPKPVKAIQDIPRRVRAPTPVDGSVLSELASGPIDFFDPRGATTSAEDLVDAQPKVAVDTSEIPARSQDEDEQVAAEALASMARARGGSESLVLANSGTDANVHHGHGPRPECTAIDRADTQQNAPLGAGAGTDILATAAGWARGEQATACARGLCAACADGPQSGGRREAFACGGEKYWLWPIHRRFPTHFLGPIHPRHPTWLLGPTRRRPMRPGPHRRSLSTRGHWSTLFTPARGRQLALHLVMRQLQRRLHAQHTLPHERSVLLDGGEHVCTWYGQRGRQRDPRL
ncbi:hypothetical protein C8F04DRAFT_1181612 [Mycena alexandri]|uniref:Uncharacterized protein n=1 Tax=Mycena alexandri TaxID=1745969 RepID=A0AAD6SZ12_9AGAR|nr:hypothetical protein C8F04DRAFT_1181612 [Mycena alexandri]